MGILPFLSQIVYFLPVRVCKCLLFVSMAVVLQKIVVDFGGVKQSYLGPPETKAK